MSGFSLFGVNLSGAEYTPAGTRGVGYDYTYPTHAEIDYFASKGMTAIRLPFLLERVDPVAGGPLSATQLSYIDDVVKYAGSKGIDVVLDPHDFGTEYGNVIGGTAASNATFADFWGELAGHFASTSNVLFGLMNEPNAVGPTQWLASANAAIAAIRAAGATTQQILVPGTDWDSAATWVSSGNAQLVGSGIVDPSHNFAFEVHQYLDSDGSGTHSTVVSTAIGVERLTAVTQWAEATGNKLFLGEFGVASDPTSLTALNNMLGYMAQHTDVWEGGTYWAAGAWWGNYMYSVEPTNGVDKPQMAVLEQYIQRTMESDGSTGLTEFGGHYYLLNAAGTGPELQYQGAPVTAGQFGTDVPIGAEQTFSGYDVAFKDSGTGLYTIWATDSSGNFTSVLFSNISGTNPELETIETTFQQDLNGDGTIGLVATVIESFGSTSLLASGNNYYLEKITSSTGPELQRGGAAVTVGEYAGWTLIGAEQVAGGGYDVALKNASTGQYSVWSTNSKGNYLSNLITHVAGNNIALESLEATFHQDVNGDGTIGLVGTAVDSHGSTSLLQVGRSYDLENVSSGTGPELQRGGAAVTVGQYAGWTLIGAEQVAGGGYDVALKNASTGQYSVWSTNSKGNYLSNLITHVAGNNIALESLEKPFHQDLNGDGTIGLVGTAIESHGSTSLLQVGHNYDLENISSATGPELQLGGAAITVGQYAGWALIGAEQMAGGGYDVALKNASTGQYSVWSTNSKGNYLSNLITHVAGNNIALESLEATFHQDLNGDGTIGLVGTAVESHGSTSLLQVGRSYDLENISSGTGRELQRGGAAVTVGEYAGWTPIGAEQVAGGGYDVALKNASTGQYSAWSTNSNGNYLSSLINHVAGNSIALESLENTFHQDINGDGTIGLVGTAIDSSGSTSLLQVGQDYDLYNISGGTGPELQRGGVAVTVGEYPGWTLIGAEQVVGRGYDLALENSSTGQYSVWSINGNGTYLSNLITQVAGNSIALESVENTFQQDLNGDGVIGTSAKIATGGTLELAAPDSVSVQFNGPAGSLILDKSSAFDGQITGLTGNGSLSGSDQIDLRDIGFGPGTTVAYTGTSSGGKLTITDPQHHTANIELAGNYTGSTFSLSSDGSGGTIVIDPAAKQALASGTLSFSDPGPTNTESVTVSPQNGGAGYVGIFTVDAVTTSNSQDSVAWHFNFNSKPGATTVVQSYEVSVADHHADGTNSTTTQSVTVTIGGAGNDAFVFHPGVGADTIVNATSTDTIELDGFASVTSSKELASLLAEAQAGVSQSLFHTANGGHDTLINLENHDVITLTNVPLSALHVSDFIVH